MRSYIDVMVDVRAGKQVDYEELRVALLFCRDMLFFTESDLEKCLDNDPSKLARSFMKRSLEDRFFVKKQPMEKWWKDGIPPMEGK